MKTIQFFRRLFGAPAAPQPPGGPPQQPQPDGSDAGRFAASVAGALAVAFWGSSLLAASYISENTYLNLAAWVLLFGVTFRFFLVAVPEVTGLAVLNFFTGELRELRSGLRFKFPWEVVRRENFVSLELVKQEREETYASQDGPMLKVKYSYQYRPALGRLVKYIQVDESVINAGFTDITSSLLSEILGGKVAVYAREHVKEVEGQVVERLKNDRVDVGGVKQTWKEKLEELYGINFKLVAMADIDYSDDYQQVRSGKARMSVFAETVKELQAQTGLVNPKDAVNTVLVEQGKAEKKIFEIENLAEAAGALAGGIAKALKGGA